MDNQMCFYGVEVERNPITKKPTGRLFVVEIAYVRAWEKVYRTPKKWSWQKQDDWNERAVQDMRDQKLIVGFAPVCDVRIGMQAARDRQGNLYLLPPKREHVTRAVPHYANGVYA